MVYKNAIYNSLKYCFQGLQNDNRIYKRSWLRFIIDFPHTFNAPAFSEKATAKCILGNLGCFSGKRQRCTSGKRQPKKRISRKRVAFLFQCAEELWHTRPTREYASLKRSANAGLQGKEKTPGPKFRGLMRDKTSAGEGYFSVIMECHSWRERTLPLPSSLT